MEPPDRAVPPRLRPHPYSCTSLWWKEHTSTRLSRSVAPPRSHHTMWCAWVNRRTPHPGNRHSRSRYLSWRISHSGGSRVTRPRPTTWPARSSITVWTRPVQQQAPGGLGVDGRASLDLTPSRAFNEPLEAGVDDHGGPVRIGFGADAGRTQGHQGVGPPGVHAPAILSPRHDRKLLCQTLQCLGHHRPLAAGSSADSPNLDDSAKYHQDRVRACSASWASWRDRLARSPLVPDRSAGHPPGPR